jgi:hypothetical protein
MSEARIYHCAVRHVRRDPVRNDFTYRTVMWLVDLDRIPRLPGPLRLLAEFRPADHAGDPRRGLRNNVESFLAGEGIDLRGGRVLMLAAARSFGHVFNPLTVYWCHEETGRLACVIAEVHNTYGGRHRYLLRPDEAGRAEVGKEFCVSPFYPVAGRYAMNRPARHRSSRSCVAGAGPPHREQCCATRSDSRVRPCWPQRGSECRESNSSYEACRSFRALRSLGASLIYTGRSPRDPISRSACGRGTTVRQVPPPSRRS